MGTIHRLDEWTTCPWKVVSGGVSLDDVLNKIVSYPTDSRILMETVYTTMVPLSTHEVTQGA